MKKIFLCAFLLHLTLNLSSQNDPKLPEVVPPSPTVANLMKFEEVPVNNYTGQPDISIPFFSKSIGKGVSFNIGLKYNTSGIQINNRSGWTGTGWSLFAGGSISRTVRDLPDEFVGFNGKKGVLRNDDYWNYATLSGTDKAEFNWKAVGSSANKYDNSLDLYQFNFLGYSGRFVILKSGSTLVPKLISRNEKFDIAISYNTTTFEINSFTITDTNGYKYIFSEHETTYSTNTLFTQSQNQTIENSNQSQYSFKSAWHLVEVKNAKNLNLLSLTYQAASEVFFQAPVRTENHITTTGSNINNIKNNTYNNTILESKISISQNSNDIFTQKLESIEFRDGTKMNLDIINGHEEFNNTSGVKLNKIRLLDVSDIEYKNFTFTYETVANRVWLTNVAEFAGGETLNTSISYHDRISLPSFGNAAAEGDSWGYYSSLDSNSSFDEDQIKAGLISKITYPTSGIKEFEFENNAYSYIGLNTVTTSQSTQNVPVNDNAYNHTYVNGSSPIFEKIKNYGAAFSFTLDFTQDIYISSTIGSGSNTQYLSYHEVQVKNTSGTYYGNAALGQTNVSIPNLPAGTYELYFVNTGSIQSNSYTIIADYKVDYFEQVQSGRLEMLGGGVRIKNINFKASPLELNYAKQVNYEYNDEFDSTKSSGVIDALENKLKSNYSINITRSLYSTLTNNSGAFGSITLGYDVMQMGPNVNVQLSQGSYIGYKHVKVSEVSYDAQNSIYVNNGYKLFNYTSANDLHKETPSSVFNLPQSAPAPNIDYKRGLLVKQRVFDKNNRVLKESVNAHTYVEEFIMTNRSVYKPTSCQYMQFYDTWTFYNAGRGGNTAEVNSPYLGYVPFKCGLAPIVTLSSSFNSGWAQLTETTTKNYYYSDNVTNTPTIVESRKTYDYNTLNYQVSTENSYFEEKGTDVHYETKYYYPVGGNLSSNSGTIISGLVALNKVNEVLETVVKRNTQTISQANTVYNKINGDNNLILPIRVEIGKNGATPESRIEFVKYDEYENPVEVKQTNGTYITYIWGYNKTYPIAKIENSTFSNIPTTIYNDVVNKSNLDKNSTGENNLRAALTSLRNHTNLTNAMVTTFTYDPAKGVTSNTDPKGYTSYFTYDAFHRLQFVKDDENKILSENQYNYKN